MTRDGIIKGVNHLLNREANSLAAYVIEAEPFVAPGQSFALKELEQIARQESERAAELRRLMTQVLRTAPAENHFPPSVADLNYLSLPYLLDLLVRDKEQLCQEYEAFLAQMSGLGEWTEVQNTVRSCAVQSTAALAQLQNLRSRLRAVSSSGPSAAADAAAAGVSNHPPSATASDTSKR
ncbi:MAG: hypothetical protein Kow0059_21700 [Candidatus Sumerlaeia bacterium]